MKSDRLISLLLLLQSRGTSTARELAQTLEVSERTVYRDVDSLGAAGVPVYAQRGSAGGIALAEGYRRTLTHFSDDEIRALFVSGASPLADLGLDGGLDRALEKLHGGLAEIQRRAADKARSRIHLDGKRWNNPSPPRDLLVSLRRAVWDDRRLEVCYEDRMRARSVRAIDPLGLVSKAGVWYLIARTAGELRTFRVERIVEARELPEHFERPPGFDLERHWTESTGTFERNARAEDCVVTVGVPAESFERVSASYWPVELLERRDDGATFRVTFPHADAAVFQLLAWSDAVDTIEPGSMRDAVVARARRALERYAKAPRNR